jgi:hypothetical protein
MATSTLIYLFIFVVCFGSGLVKGESSLIRNSRQPKKLVGALWAYKRLKLKIYLNAINTHYI